jgi:hypothetical protein
MTSAIEDRTRSSDQGKLLLSCYPNPFNNASRIIYTLPSPGDALIRLWDILGRQVHLVAEGYQHKGTYEIPLVLDNFPSGTYFLTLELGGAKEVRPIQLVK